ncbi:nucleotide exchange factor GrpE [Shouchella shacheensis]|uniref:nucleotide exchange factor GrpE n=1 Tax=Shouchella shacheensis TaxID=1649580 RepID=UPI00073FFDEA|nr:nucleotide exchange factor GrpE [Shouchella shacheensis]
MTEERRDEQEVVADEKEQQVEEPESLQAEDTDEATDANAQAAEEIEINPLELADVKNRLARVQADYDNFRRRSREEKEAQAKYRAQGFIEELLPALDNFERALAVEPESEEAKQLLEGMKMVYRQLQEALTKEGVEAIATEGETFDPHRHQAVMQVEEEGFEPNQIVEELQKGYQLKDRVLRHSMVKVNV